MRRIRQVRPAAPVIFNHKQMEPIPVLDEPMHDRENSEQSPCGPQSWVVVGAIHGRGTLLMGPWMDAGERMSGAWVFAPPGVRLATPISDDPDAPPVSIFGWRQAVWMPDQSGSVIIDHSRPNLLRDSSLDEVLTLVLEHCPEHALWVKERLESLMTTLHLQTRCDATGRRAPSAAIAERTMNELVAEAEAALDEHAVALGGQRTIMACGGDHHLHPGCLRRLRMALDGHAARVASMDRRALLDETLDPPHA